MGIESLTNTRFELFGVSAEAHRRLLDGFGHKKFHAEIKHEHEGEQLHRGLDKGPREKRRKAGKGNETVNGFHCRRAHSDHKGPIKAAASALVHDGQIDGTNRYGENKAAEKSGESGEHDWVQLEHAGLSGMNRVQGWFGFFPLFDLGTHFAGDSRCYEPINQIKREKGGKDVEKKPVPENKYQPDNNSRQDRFGECAGGAQSKRLEAGVSDGADHH